MILEIFPVKSSAARTRHRRPRAAAVASVLVALCCAVAGCNGLPKSSSDAVTKPGPQTYLGDTSGGVLESYTIDDTAMTFDQVTYSIAQGGAQITNSGKFTVLQRNLRDLSTTYTTSATLPQTDGWAVELANQAGGLVQMSGQNFASLVPATACPGKTAQVYQFVTVPNSLLDPSIFSFAAGTVVNGFYDPAIETGYGTVSVSGSGSTITLSGISQHTLPVAGASGTPANPSPGSVTGVCASTLYGETTSVPGQIVVTSPGNNQTVSATATIGIGPTGLLVEDNGGSSPSVATYQNVLGAGIGAIGLPQPSSTVDTSALIGAQYLGFFYGSGHATNSGGTPVASVGTSSVASFGLPSTPAAANCPTIPGQPTALIYGGDFNGNNPADPTVQTAGGFGNCDYAIDLGTEDGTNNGLYPAATVWVGNTTHALYSYPAVAIAGQLGGKYAIFVLGVDTTGTPNQAQGIYLLQSN